MTGVPSDWVACRWSAGRVLITPRKSYRTSACLAKGLPKIRWCTSRSAGKPAGNTIAHCTGHARRAGVASGLRRCVTVRSTYAAAGLQLDGQARAGQP